MIEPAPVVETLAGSGSGSASGEPRPSMDGLPRTDYAQHTWLELRELAGRDGVVVVIPTATREDRGYHLPIDTDVRLIEAIARGAVERVNVTRGEDPGDGAMLFPPAVHGYTPHHMDFPGTVTLRWNVFVESLLDCARSLCRHGFDRILILNGHGSNAPLVDVAARLINVEHRGAVCTASTLYLSSLESSELLRRERDSEPGGMSHACELETSMYLALAPELVQMDKAVREIPHWNENISSEWPGGGPLSYMPHWSGLSRSGLMGDATVATAAKGRVFLERAREEAARCIAETASRVRAPGSDHHRREREPDHGRRDGEREPDHGRRDGEREPDHGRR